MTEEITGYECSACGDLWEDERDAEDCCNPHAEQIRVYKCSGCEELYREKEDADYCCPIANNVDDMED